MIIKNKLERLMFNDNYNERHKNGPRFCVIASITYVGSFITLTT